MILLLRYKTIKYNLLALAVCCVLCTNGNAQQEKTVSLITYFNSIASQFNVTFSYNPDVVANISIHPKQLTSIESTLDYLANTTNLKFEILENRYITVVPNTKPIPLEDVIVTNYLVKGIDKNSNGAFHLSTKTLGTLPGLVEPDILQTAQVLPGIESANETISNIQIRGGSHDQNLILWNGIKIYHSGHFFGLISAFNPFVTNNITIIKNGASATYGDAVSGIIDMTSNLKTGKGLEAGIGTSLLNADAYVNYAPTDKLSVQLSVRHSITEAISSPIFKSYLEKTLDNSLLTVNNLTRDTENDSFLFYDVTGSIAYAFTPKHIVRVNAIKAFDNLHYSEQGAANYTNNSIIQESIGSNGVLTSQWNSTTKTNIAAYYSAYNLNAHLFDVSNNQSLIQENNVLETAIKASITKNITANTHITLGYQFTETGVKNLVDVSNPYYFKSVKKVRRVHAALAEAVYKKNNTAVTIGTRINHYNKLNTTTVEPRATFNQFINKNVSIKLQGEIRSQSTTQVIELQQDFLGIEKKRWMLANGTDIPIIKSKQLSAGLDYKQNNWLLSTDVFYKYGNGISTKTQGFQNQYQLTNTTGSYTAKGVEILLNKQSTHFNFWTSYTLSENNYTFKTLNPPTFPNNVDVRHSVDAALIYSYKQFTVGVNWKYRTGTPFTTPKKGDEINDQNLPPTINFGMPNQEYLTNYTRTDVSASYNFFNNRKIKGKITIALLNIFNHKNVLKSYYQLDGTNEHVVNITNQSLGFSPNLSLRFTL